MLHSVKRWQRLTRRRRRRWRKARRNAMCHQYKNEEKNKQWMWRLVHKSNLSLVRHRCVHTKGVSFVKALPNTTRTKLKQWEWADLSMAPTTTDSARCAEKKCFHIACWLPVVGHSAFDPTNISPPIIRFSRTRIFGNSSLSEQTHNIRMEYSIENWWLGDQFGARRNG